MWPKPVTWSKQVKNDNSMVLPKCSTLNGSTPSHSKEAVTESIGFSPNQDSGRSPKTPSRLYPPASRTPRRSEISRSSVSSNTTRTPSETKGCFHNMRNSGRRATPKSGPRINPFDSQLSHDTLHLPTFSPSVFSTVISPSQESSSSGRFWSVDQQAALFPAQISDDSPWKQELATSQLDPELEGKTQGAIDLYFSRHHKITSPDDIPQNMMSNDRSILSLVESELGGSPDLSKFKLKSTRQDRDASVPKSASQPASPSGSPVFEPNQPRSSSCNNSCQNVAMSALDVSKISSDQGGASCAGKITCSRFTQTVMTLPPVLPREVEEVLEKWNFVLQDKSDNFSLAPTAKHPASSRSFSRIPLFAANAAGSVDHATCQEFESNSLSTSTLRRKLFEEMLDGEPVCDSAGGADKTLEESDMDNRSFEDVSNRPLIDISPGAIILTPTAKAGPIPPGHGLMWSLSPVSRNKKKPRDDVGPPIESSTPTKD